MAPSTALMAVTTMTDVMSRLYARDHFTNDIYLKLSILWPIDIAVIQLPTNRLLQIFAHATTAECHVQNFVVITWFKYGLEQNEISFRSELKWKKKVKWEFIVA